MRKEFSDLHIKHHDTTESRGRPERGSSDDVLTDIRDVIWLLKNQGVDNEDLLKHQDTLIINNRRRFNDLDDLGPDPENLREETSEKLFGSPYGKSATTAPSHRDPNTKKVKGPKVKALGSIDPADYNPEEDFDVHFENARRLNEENMRAPVVLCALKEALKIAMGESTLPDRERLIDELNVSIKSFEFKAEYQNMVEYLGYLVDNKKMGKAYYYAATIIEYLQGYENSTEISNSMAVDIPSNIESLNEFRITFRDALS